MNNILITGGCGFIGSNFINYIVKKLKNISIYNIDALYYSASINNIDIQNNIMYEFIQGNINDYNLIAYILKTKKIDTIIHFAAQSHVDNSFLESLKYTDDNVKGTHTLLEAVKNINNNIRFIHISTDEVYGETLNTAKKETDILLPTNPYAASKAACEMICMAYENTYKIPIIISEMVNCIGQRQHVEKFVPKVIKTLLDDEELVIHADPTATIPGSRYYIHARNTADAVLFLLKNGQIGESYNICTKDEIDNLTMALRIAEIVGKPLRYKLVDFHSERAGHDLVYRLDGTKLQNLGWKPPVDFDESLKKTVEWYLEYPQWLEE